MKDETYLFDDGTEPTVLRCHGPCEQGRKPCPVPAACEAGVDDAPESLGRLVVLGLGIVCLVGAIAFVVGVLV